MVDWNMCGCCYCSGIHDLDIKCVTGVFWMFHAMRHVVGGNCILSAQ
jgi:hypothetical protein